MPVVRASPSPESTESTATFAVRPDDASTAHWRIVRPMLAVTLAEPPEWAPFLPVPGTYQHPIYGELDFSPEAYDRIVANFQSGAYQERIPVNCEHDLPASGAVGWITDMRRADDGSVDARVEWNARGKSLIADDRFRYVSAEVWDTWTDPVTGAEVRDVATGLAICTNPYFKESALRPLAASEAVITRVVGGAERGAETLSGGAQTPLGGSESGSETPVGGAERGAESDAETPKETSMSEQDEQDTAVEAVTLAEPPPKAKAPKAKDPGSDPNAKFDEAAAQEFAQLRRDKTRLEDENKRLVEDRTKLLAASREKRFTDEVRGHSDQNGRAYVGDIPDHVRMLCDVEEQFGPASWHIQHYQAVCRAYAELAAKSDVFREIGSGRAGDVGPTAEDKAEAQAKALAAVKGISVAQAYTELLDTDRELRAAIARERQGGR